MYGDRGGARIDETAPLRARRPIARAAAPTPRRDCAVSAARAASSRRVLRVPGIYALDRAGGDPRERVVRGTPVLAAADDVYTSHIHADDLARACVAALHRGRPQRVVNVVDDSDLRMGDYFDFVADRFGLPRPPRLARGDAAARLSPLQMSFLGESRRLVNRAHEARAAPGAAPPDRRRRARASRRRCARASDNRGRPPVARGDVA